MENIRSVVELWPHRQRRHVVVACLDETAELEGAVPEIEGLRATLLVEREPGPLSAALGRPSVTVASRYGRVGLRGRSAAVTEVLETLELFELSCPECGPQAWGDPGGVGELAAHA